eukprot:SAG22_NODE_1397_length_4507_cov_56.156534_7_plen_119_part_00
MEGEWLRILSKTYFTTTALWCNDTQASILPRVRKVHRVIPGGLTAGTYTLQIRNNYDPFIFQGGTKEFYLATVHPTLGGANPLLAWSYIGVGSLCLVMGVAFSLKSIFYSDEQAAAEP